MMNEQKFTKAIIEQVDLIHHQVRLGIDFMATLDKKTYFPKHISLFTKVEDMEILEQLSLMKPGTMILAQIRSGSEKHSSYLEKFELID